MADLQSNEIIVVRSLTTSDLGLFASHRASAHSKQRALNINAEAAKRLLSYKLFKRRSCQLNCQIFFGDFTQNEVRHLGKSKKNWRLGGKKIEGAQFAELDSLDFALIKSIEGNDGTHPVHILFVAKTKERVKHAKIGRLLEPTIKRSMAVYRVGSAGFDDLAQFFPEQVRYQPAKPAAAKEKEIKKVAIPPMPDDVTSPRKKRTIKEKIHSPHIMEQMLKVSSDLSAPAQLSFFEDIELLAGQLREVLLACKRIVKLEKNHAGTWKSVKGKPIGYVDGGLANLSMIGSAPVAARVGGYIVIPGDESDNRERFITLKRLINELYTSNDGGVYNGSFPDRSAVKDAARISIEAAGAIQMMKEEPDLEFLFLHGALVNPVSRYTDIMKDEVPRFTFPSFSESTLEILLSESSKKLKGDDANFINVYYQQLLKLSKLKTCVCGVIEREATTTSVIKALLDSLDDFEIRNLVAPTWKQNFLSFVNPADDEEETGYRITDSLLLQCVLEAGEVILPVPLNRNVSHKAPRKWRELISKYPQPYVSYLQPTEWNPPIRIEIFEKDLLQFHRIANLVYHSALLLPRYAFPAGLDIVDKFAKIPNWMTRPINTNTAVRAMKMALDNNDTKLFDNLRRMMCGSNREFFLRPNILK
jgi:hypothetical protein